jgi:glycosyltransferase involved in cell wall biosynthesis
VTKLVFSNVRSDHLVQRHHYVASWLAQQAPTFWIDTLGSRNPRLSDLSRICGEKAGQEDENNLRNVEVISPRRIPYLGNRLVNDLNSRCLRRQLAKAQVAPAETDVWVYLPHPAVLEQLKTMEWRTLIYELCDEIDDMDVHPSLRECEKELLARADIVFASSEQLVTKARRFQENVYYVPNGVDAERFRGTRLEPHERFTATYVGAIYEWVDEHLICEVAERMPEVQFRLVGPVRRSLDRARLIPNITVPGPIPSSEVPQELAKADVAIIPFRQGALTKATDPLKLYEALVMELPVLGTELEQAARFGDAVRLETSSDRWVCALNELKSGKWNYDRQAVRRAVIENEDWSVRFRQMKDALDSE